MSTTILAIAQIIGLSNIGPATYPGQQGIITTNSTGNNIIFDPPYLYIINNTVPASSYSLNSITDLMQITPGTPESDQGPILNNDGTIDFKFTNYIYDNTATFPNCNDDSPSFTFESYYTMNILRTIVPPTGISLKQLFTAYLANTTINGTFKLTPVVNTTNLYTISLLDFSALSTKAYKSPINNEQICALEFDFRQDDYLAVIQPILQMYQTAVNNGNIQFTYS